MGDGLSQLPGTEGVFGLSTRTALGKHGGLSPVRPHVREGDSVSRISGTEHLGSSVRGVGLGRRL